MNTAVAVPCGTGEADWDAMLPSGSAALGSGFLHAWESAELPGLTPRRLTVRDEDGRILGGAAGYLYDLDAATVQRALLPTAVGLIRRVYPRFLVMRVLELGAPCAFVDPLLVSEGADAPAVAGEVVAAAVREACRSRAQMIVVQDRVDPGGPLAAALRSHRFTEVHALPTVVLDLTAHASLEHYLESMRHKYRRRARCVMRDSAHLRVERLSDFAALADEFARLWRLVYDRATETRREILGAPFFAAAARLPATGAVVLRRGDGSIAAFGLLLRDRPWLHFLQCGFDAAAGREEAAYFRLTFEIVRQAIEERFTHLNLGCTTLGPKLDLGGVPVPLCAWIRHRHPAVQRVFAAAARACFQPPSVAARRVFAETGAGG